VDVYVKSASDVVGKAPIDPTLGFNLSPGAAPFVFSNVASLKGKGFDIQLNSTNVRGQWQWTTTFSLSYNSTKVTRYLYGVGKGNNYLDPGVANPVIGRPVNSLYSLRGKGLDPNSGDPLGSYAGTASNDYAGIWNNTPVDSLHYNGPTQPTWFGFMRHNFSWRKISLSILFSYQLGYWFRRPSINYSDLINTWNGHADYARRWQHPGDEKWTQVPSAIYAPYPERDDVYVFSDQLATNGGVVRLESVNLAYDIPVSPHHSPAGRKLLLFLNASGLGILWRANHFGLDPASPGIPLDRMRVSVGASLSL
jgi:hypothetical protein